MLAEAEITKLKKRFSANEADTKYVRGVWNELEKYIVPYRGRMFQNETNEGSVEWDKYDHYDDTAVIAASTLAASIHGALLPQLQWFDLKFKDAEINDNDEASNWLADSTRRTYHAIDNSNFSLEADELILDMVGFGHGFMTHESGGTDEDELEFSMIPLKEAFFEEGYDGVPRYFFRKLQWVPSKLVSKFGYDNLPKTIQDKYDNAATADTKIDVIFCVFPREDKKDADISKPLTPTERPFGHVYFTLTDGEQLGEEGGYYEMPVYSVRWRKVSGSQWGHGPGHISLGDIKQLNQHRLMRTRAIEKAIDPANITTERGLLSNLDLGPRGLTVLRKMDALAPYEGKANFQISTEELMILQKSVKQAFMTDQLELKESPAMTATEVQVRYELMHRLLGPTLGRIKIDWLNRVVQSVFNTELRAGRFKELPDILANREFEIGIEYVGALATSQKAQQANDVMSWANDTGQLSQIYPDMKYSVNQIELGSIVARLRNLPEKAINSKDEAMKQKSDDAKLIAQQQKIMEAQQQGAAMEAQGKGQQALNEAEAQGAQNE